MDSGFQDFRMYGIWCFSTCRVSGVSTGQVGQEHEVGALCIMILSGRLI